MVLGRDCIFTYFIGKRYEIIIDILCGTATENQAFKQGIGCETVSAVNTGFRTFTAAVKSLDVCTRIEIGFDAAHQIVLRRMHRDHIMRHVDTAAFAFAVYSRKTG